MTVGMCHCDVGTDCTVLKPDVIFGAGLDKWLPVWPWLLHKTVLKKAERGVFSFS